MKVQRALISVADKTGLETFARGLHALGIALISSGGTAKALTQAGMPVTTVEHVTGHAELLSGRVKTLHPAIHGGILARRDDAQHMRDLAAHQIAPIDLVVVNLYPFEITVKDPQVTVDAAIEQIDIGGVALLRAAAKNHLYVGAVCDPAQYTRVLEELRTNEQSLGVSTRRALAVESFARTARYDLAIQHYLSNAGRTPTLPAQLTLLLEQEHVLRYGENPHQKGVWYQPVGFEIPGLSHMRQLGGKDLSYNNLLDVGTALSTVWEHAEPTVCIVKHLSPCGVASHVDVTQAFQQARACDPLSAFGGIVGCNWTIDATLAQAIAASGFLEVVVAPHIEPDAADILTAKQMLRVLAVPGLPTPGEGLPALPWDIRTVAGSVLVQSPDRGSLREATVRVVTKRTPTQPEQAALEFAWRCVKHVRSNAIVLATASQTIGIGGGLPSRIDAVREAIRKAGDRVQGTVLASDAFLPKTDNVDVAATAGVTAIIQPGGSKRDEDVIAAADQAGLAMLFTGLRHFKH